MSELKLGPVTRPADSDAFDSMVFDVRVEGFDLYERSVNGVVVALDNNPSTALPDGMTERKVAAFRVNGERTYVVAYEVIPEEERRTAALIASAKAKLTPEEFHAVQKYTRT